MRGLATECLSVGETVSCGKSISSGFLLFLVTGNSGSGKDSVMRGAAELCPGIHIMTRFITRPLHHSESFVSVSGDEFRKLASEDFFCMVWESYGIHYGVPSELDNILSQGVPVLVNISRDVIREFKKLYPEAKVVSIKADIEALRRRILERGREQKGSEAVMSRMARAEQNLNHDIADCIIDNSDDLGKASESLCRFIAETVCSLETFTVLSLKG